MVENVTWIKGGKMINIDVSAKIQENIIHEKEKLSGILLHVIVKMLNI